MRPYYKIEIDGSDQTKKFQGRILSVSVTDQDGITSDSCELVLRDKGELEIPAMNTKMRVSLGIIGRGLTSLGTFLLSEPDLNPGIMRLKGRAAPIGKSFSSPRERLWEDQANGGISCGQIIEKIAGEHGLKAAVEQIFFEEKQENISQTESDMSFITRLGMLKNATFKVQSGYLVFASSGSEDSVFGKKLPVVEILNPKTWNYKGASNDEYTGVKAYYKNPDEKGKRLDTLAGGSETPFELIQTWDSLFQATEKARAKLKSLQKTRVTLSLTKASDDSFDSVSLASGQTSIIKGVRKNVDGKWKAKKVTHNFTNETLSVSAEFEPVV